MQDRAHEPTADTVKPTAPTECDVKKPHARKEDGFSNPKDGRGPLRRTDDQGAKLPTH